jgi:HK97 family phage portal protein
MNLTLTFTERLSGAGELFRQLGRPEDGAPALGFKARLGAARGFLRDSGQLAKAGAGPADVKSAHDYIPTGVLGRPQRPPTNFGALFKMHKTSELVYACIRAIAYAVSDPEPIIEKKTAEGKWEPTPDHPLRRLLLFPNPTMDGATFMQQLAASTQITGWLYAEIVRDGLGLPDQLWPLDPTKLAPVPGPDGQGGFIKGYEFRDGSRREFIEARNIVAFKLHNPASRFQALSPLEVAAASVDADLAQTDYIRAFFGAAGVPSGVLKVKKSLSDEQIKALQTKWLLKYGRRGTMQGAPAVLDADADYQKTGSNLDELESDKVRGQGQASICSAFGVPPILVGAYVGLVNVNQRASVAEASRDFGQHTIMPMMRLLRLFLTTRLLSEFEGMALVKGDRVRLNWDFNHVAWAQEDKDASHTRAREDFNKGGLTWNEYRAKIGEAPDPVNGNFIVLPRTVQPITLERAQAQAATPPATPPVVGGGAPGNGDQGGAPGADPGQGGKGQGKGGASGKANPNRAPEVKGVAFDGLDLRREPTDIEKKAGLPAIVKAMDSGAARMGKALLTIREAFIADAVGDLRKMDEGQEHTLALDISSKQTKTVRGLLDQAFGAGRETVAAALEAGGAKGLAGVPRGVNLKAAAGAYAERLDALTSATLTKLANDVQARAVGRLAELVLLGVDQDADAPASKSKPASFWKRLEEDLEESSTLYAERAASGSTNAALNLGRTAEAEVWKDEIKRVVYSAVLDSNTCQYCIDADGEEGATDDDLPSVPNGMCEGGSKCRCIHIFILDE